MALRRAGTDFARGVLSFQMVHMLLKNPGTPGAYPFASPVSSKIARTGVDLVLKIL